MLRLFTVDATPHLRDKTNIPIIMYSVVAALVARSSQARSLIEGKTSLMAEVRKGDCDRELQTDSDPL